MQFLKYSFVSIDRPIFAVDVVAESEKVAWFLAKDHVSSYSMELRLHSVSESLELGVCTKIYSMAYRETVLEKGMWDHIKDTPNNDS